MKTYRVLLYVCHGGQQVVTEAQACTRQSKVGKSPPPNRGRHFLRPGHPLNVANNIDFVSLLLQEQTLISSAKRLYMMTSPSLPVQKPLLLDQRRERRVGSRNHRQRW